jgi:hypothetical protein
MFLKSLYVSLLVSFLPVSAMAQSSLHSEEYVVTRLSQARAADLIRKNCDTISARLTRAFFEAQALKGWARDQGYSNEEIDLFIKDKEEKKYVFALADRYLESRGFTGSNWCEVGQQEISGNTLAGSLLK